jgi:predicted nucleic acid-binding protein
MNNASLHLETSFLIRALIQSSPEHALLRNWLEEGRKPDMSSIAWAEFLSGPLSEDHLTQATMILNELLPFDPEDAAVAAELFNRSGRKRQIFRDCLIAASALRHGAEIATSNRSDFDHLGVPLAS